MNREVNRINEDTSRYIRNAHGSPHEQINAAAMQGGLKIGVGHFGVISQHITYKLFF